MSHRKERIMPILIYLLTSILFIASSWILWFLFTKNVPPIHAMKVWPNKTITFHLGEIRFLLDLLIGFIYSVVLSIKKYHKKEVYSIHYAPGLIIGFALGLFTSLFTYFYITLAIATLIGLISGIKPHKIPLEISVGLNIGIAIIFSAIGGLPSLCVSLIGLFLGSAIRLGFNRLILALVNQSSWVKD